MSNWDRKKGRAEQLREAARESTRSKILEKENMELQAKNLLLESRLQLLLTATTIYAGKK